MKFCSVCGRAIKKKIIMGSVVFRCVCTNIEESTPEDVLISNMTTSTTDTPEMYYNLIELAPFDRTNQIIKKDCPLCGLNYLTQIRVGVSEIVIYKCKCGYKLRIE